MEKEPDVADFMANGHFQYFEEEVTVEAVLVPVIGLRWKLFRKRYH